MRLNANIKKAILEAALKKAGIPERRMAVTTKYNQWAEAVRLRYVTPDIMVLIDSMKAVFDQIPQNLLSNNDLYHFDYEIYRANVAGQVRTVKYGEIDDRGYLVKRITPKEVTLTADDPLTELLHQIDDDELKLKSEEEHLTASINAVLNSVSTDKKLFEVWPEAVAFIPAAQKAATSNLPALQISELNKALGLP